MHTPAPTRRRKGVWLTPTPARCRAGRGYRRLSAPLLAITGVVTALSGCGIAGIPSQQRPACSWGTQIPSNADALCTVAFKTLSTLVRDEVRGNDRAIHLLVSNATVARRIIVFGRDQRANHIIFLHVVPSITLATTQQGLLGAGFFIVGKTHSGKISAPETVYMRVYHVGVAASRAVVVEDQPDQEW